MGNKFKNGDSVWINCTCPYYVGLGIIIQKYGNAYITRIASKSFAVDSTSYQTRKLKCKWNLEMALDLSCHLKHPVEYIFDNVLYLQEDHLTLVEKR